MISEGNENSEQQKVTINLDSQSGDGLQQGLDALQKVFGGLVDGVKNAIGPEMMRNLEASQWLEQLAICLDAIVKALPEHGTVPADALGQLSFYLEQFDSAIAGSKFESQRESLERRLRNVEEALHAFTTENASETASVLLRSAGYFHAAAKSIVQVPGAS